jgi:glycosyltransferase involved in cell wall biosynthesis
MSVVKEYFDVTFICDSLDSGGIQRVVSTLANEWARRGLKVCVVTRSGRTFFVLAPPIVRVSYVGASMLRVDRMIHGLAQYIINASNNLAGVLGGKRFWFVSVVGAILRSLFWTLPYQIYFIARLNRETWCLRHTLMRFDSPVLVSMGTFSNVTTIKASRQLNRRVVISERGDVNRLRLMRPWYRYAKQHYGRADVVTANTHAALRDMQEFVAREKLAFVPNPIAQTIIGSTCDERNHGSSISTLNSRASNILIVARLWPEKAHDVLLDAFAQMGEEYCSWRLVIAGDGPLRSELQARAERLGVANRIDWLGAVEDLRSIYEATEIFVLPSRSEGMPNALLEAMSCSRAVVTSDASPGPLELVEHDVTGVVVPVDDSVALASALRRLASDDVLRYRLGEAARMRVSDHQLPRALANWASVIGIAI